jgi:cytochrome c556
MHSKFWGLLAGTLLVVNVASADSPAERAIEYRQGIYSVIGWNFGLISNVAKGQTPYNKDAVALRAERVAYMVPMLSEAFPEGSVIAGKTEAKPEIWTQRADFDALLKKLATKTTELATIAKSGDLAKITTATQETGQVCKECHKKFKKD